MAKHGVKHSSMEDMDQYVAGLLLAVQALQQGNREYRDWSVAEDRRTGGWNIENRELDLFAYATPFWEDEDGVLIEMTDMNGDLIEFGRIPFPTTGDVTIDAKFYLDLMVLLLPHIAVAHEGL